MATFNEMINSPKSFDQLVTSLAELFTQTYNFQKYSPSSTKKFASIMPFVKKVPMAGLIDPNSKMPQVGLPKALDMNGEMPSWGISMSFTVEELNRIKELEKFIKDKVAAPADLVSYVTEFFERVSLAPSASLYKVWWEFLSSGLQTYNDVLTGNPMYLDWNVDNKFVSTVWSDSVNADGFADLKAFAKMKEDKGQEIIKFRMNKNTWRQFIAQKKVSSVFESTFVVGQSTVKFGGQPSLEQINMILEKNFMLPPIEIVSPKYSEYNESRTDGGDMKQAFIDGRVAGMCSEITPTVIWTPAGEASSNNPDPRKTYSFLDSSKVLVSKLSQDGKITLSSELTALPVPSSIDDLCILTTDATA